MNLLSAAPGNVIHENLDYPSKSFTLQKWIHFIDLSNRLVFTAHIDKSSCSLHTQVTWVKLLKETGPNAQ